MAMIVAIASVLTLKVVAPSPSASVSPSPSASASRLPVMDYDEPPKIVKVTKPVYPPQAFADRIEGTVEIELLIDETGVVSRTRVVRSIPALDEAALKCVKQWRFTPARKGGIPVATVASAPVTFRIKARKR